MLLTRHQRKPSFAYTYALPCSGLDAFCILLFAALIIDLCCLPYVLTPWSHQLDYALDLTMSSSTFPVLFAVLLSWAALARVWQPLWQIL